MNKNQKMTAAPLRWLKIIAYFFSPVDTSSPDTAHGNAASGLGLGCETLGRLKLVFWMVVSVILAQLLSRL